jgi:lycopene elongase/hydratase (dihydrobisanhydrobacterioruberin-forming)
MNIYNLIKISRPRFWLYLAGPFLLGYFFGVNYLHVDYKFIYTLFYFLIPANIYLYGINDYFDSDTDVFNKKKSDKEHLLQKKEKLFLVIFLIISVLLLVPILFWSSFYGTIILCSWLLLSTMYSAPPRFKAIPFLDFFSNILYVLPAFYIYYELTNALPHILIILASFTWVWAMHLYSAIPDISADKRAKVITSAVYLGSKKSIFLCIFFWFIFSLFISIKIFPYGLVTIIYPFLGFISYFNLEEIGKIYWYFPYINGFIGFLGYLYPTLLLLV